MSRQQQTSILAAMANGAWLISKQWCCFVLIVLMLTINIASADLIVGERRYYQQTFADSLVHPTADNFDNVLFSSVNLPDSDDPRAQTFENFNAAIVGDDLLDAFVACRVGGDVPSCEITLRFDDNEIVNQEGPDFTVFEVGGEPEEFIVSINGVERNSTIGNVYREIPLPGTSPQLTLYVIDFDLDAFDIGRDDAINELTLILIPTVSGSADILAVGALDCIVPGSTLSFEHPKFTKIADTETPIPGGNGAFGTFNAFSVPAIDNGKVGFQGVASNVDPNNPGFIVNGIYLYEVGSVDGAVIADSSLPSTLGVSVFGPPSIDGEKLAFWAAYSSYAGIFMGDEQGVNIVADSNTVIPGTEGGQTFFSIGGEVGVQGLPSIDGNNVAFYGINVNAALNTPPIVRGVYQGSNPETLNIVTDLTWPVPGHPGISFDTFFNSSGVQSYPMIDGDDVVFYGQSNNLQGVYTNIGGVLDVVADTDQNLLIGKNIKTIAINNGAVTFETTDAIFSDRSGVLATVTTLPEQTTSYPRIIWLSFNNGKIAFRATANNNVDTAIYIENGNSFINLIDDSNTILDGKKVLSGGLDFGREGLSGNQVAFSALLENQESVVSSGVYVASPGFESCPLPEEPIMCAAVVPSPCRIIELVAGSPASLSQLIDIPAMPTLLSFDYLFRTTSGELKVFLDGIEISSIQAPGSLPTNVLTAEVLINSDFLGRTGAILDFRLDGPAGSIVWLDNIVFPSLVNGDFQDGGLSGWTATTTGASAINVLTFIGLALEANAGPDQSVNEGDLVTLDGSASNGSEPLNYTWTQLAGPPVTPDVSDPEHPTFVAPFVGSNTTLTFVLVVDDGTNFSDPDSVDVIVVSTNDPPVADAGDNATIKEGAEATLDGSNSFDPNSDAITYQWSQVVDPMMPMVTLLPNEQAAQPTFIAPEDAVGNVLIFKLMVSDGLEDSIPSEGADSSNADTVAITIVENSAPIADAGTDDTKDEGETVNLDGTNSFDPDGGDTLRYAWTQIDGPIVTLNSATSASPSFNAPSVGEGGNDVEFELTVTDDDPINPKSDSDQVIVHVRNINDPPDCNLAYPSSESLWPPNHKMKSITIEGAMDEGSVMNTIVLQITAVTQDEPVNGLGDGDTNPDAIIQSNNLNDSVLIRAERSGNGNGRVYEISFRADDGFESCTGSVKVSVPHNRKDTAIDDGQVYDSTQF